MDKSDNLQPPSVGKIAQACGFENFAAEAEQIEMATGLKADISARQKALAKVKSEVAEVAGVSMDMMEVNSSVDGYFDGDFVSTLGCCAMVKEADQSPVLKWFTNELRRIVSVKIDAARRVVEAQARAQAPAVVEAPSMAGDINRSDMLEELNKIEVPEPEEGRPDLELTGEGEIGVDEKPNDKTLTVKDKGGEVLLEVEGKVEITPTDPSKNVDIITNKDGTDPAKNVDESPNKDDGVALGKIETKKVPASEAKEPENAERPYQAFQKKMASKGLSPKEIGAAWKKEKEAEASAATKQ